jgi:hypothetical protein
MTLTKTTIIDNLRAFARQRPGLEFGDYGDPATAYRFEAHSHCAEVLAYRADQRSITRDLAEALTMLRSVELRDSITAADLIRASEGAFSGRLTINPETGTIDYCTGQYWPTEYRRAVCAVLSSALWDYWRDNMPEPVATVSKDYGHGLVCDQEVYTSRKLTAGDYLRRQASNEFGRGIARRWFN